MLGWKPPPGHLSPHRLCDEIRYETPEPTFSPSPPSASLSKDFACEGDESMPPRSYQTRRRTIISDSEPDSVSGVSRHRVHENNHQSDPHVEIKSLRGRARVARGASSSTCATPSSRYTRVSQPTDATSYKSPGFLRTPHTPEPRSGSRDRRRLSSREQSATVSACSDTREEQEEANYDVAAFQAELYSSRSLRKRTVQQTNPYKFDKYQHTISRRTGQSPDPEDVEEAVNEEIEMTQARLSSKKQSKASNAGTKRKRKTPALKRNGKRRHLEPTLSTTDEESRVTSFDPAKVTLKVWLDGFPAASAPTTLLACGDVDRLFDFIVESWGWSVEGASIRYAIISFPWLDEESNILLRPGMRDSFTRMVSEVEKAECWKSGGNEAACEIKITVFMESAK